jgi:hypothetical protein
MIIPVVICMPAILMQQFTSIWITHKSRYQWALFSSNKEVGDFTATFHWCKKANLTRAGSGEANKGDRRGC